MSSLLLARSDSQEGDDVDSVTMVRQAQPAHLPSSSACTSLLCTVADPPTRSLDSSVRRVPDRAEGRSSGSRARSRSRGRVSSRPVLLVVASQAGVQKGDDPFRNLDPVLCDDGRSRTPLRGSPGFPPGSLLSPDPALGGRGVGTFSTRNTTSCVAGKLPAPYGVSPFETAKPNFAGRVRTSRADAVSAARPCATRGTASDPR